MHDDSYEKLSPTEIQQILFYESAVTTALLFNTKGYETELSEIYKFLGVFYGSRFYSTLEDNKFDSTEIKDDFYRAQFYFDRAISLKPDSYNLYMFAGHFSQYYDNKSVATISFRYFESASGFGAQYQKPLVSQSLIKLEAFGDPLSALDLLRAAQSRGKYDYDDDREYPRPEYIAYLESCAFCLAAQKEHGSDQQRTLKKAARKISEAAKKPSTDWTRIADSFEDDRKKYFSLLENDPGLGPEATENIETLKTYVLAAKERES